MAASKFVPQQSMMLTRVADQYGDIAKHGWRVRMWQALGYIAPDAWYEAVVDQLVTERTRWIDVGGGKNVFPINGELAKNLAARCELLVGLDPSAGLLENDVVGERVQSTIEEYETNRSFDLATLRMVAEHIESPDHAIASLARIVKPGGKVVIYTPNRWAPVSLAAATLPFCIHAPLTRFLYGVDDEDVFPTVYRMNTRRVLRKFFERYGFREVAFAYLDDCSSLSRFKALCLVELLLRKGFRFVKMRYPENVLLGVYERGEGAHCNSRPGRDTHG